MVVDQDPLAQFEIKKIADWSIGGVDVSFTNASAWMVGVLIFLSLFMILSMRSKAVVPGRSQTVVELVYEFVVNMVRDNLGREGKPYFPFVFTLFIFILGLNLAGMLPYSFTATSHIVVTLGLALTVFIGVTILGFIKNGFGFLKLFVPDGAPLWLLPMIVPIEVISYCVRPISLSVRLFANMFAGHMTMKIFAGFVISLTAGLGIVGGFMAILPFVFTVMLTGLELLVAALQAYVFAILTCIYINDALHPSH